MRWSLCRFLIGAAVLLSASLLDGLGQTAQPPAVPVLAPRVLTNLVEIWRLPRREAALPHRIRTEVLIYFFDPEWNNASGECQGLPLWLPLANSPLPLKPGQRVEIDGVIIPERQQLLWDQTRLRILEEGVALKAEPVADPAQHPQSLKNRLISVEALVDGSAYDPTHYKLKVLLGNTPAMAYVLKGTNTAERVFKEGTLLRLKAVFVPQFDPNGNLSYLTLAVASPADVEVIGTLDTDPRFQLPVTPSESIEESTPTNELLHVQGVVRNYEPGRWVTLWDASGQVLVESKQHLPLRFGDRVEAIGYPFAEGLQRGLHQGLYRLAVATNEPVQISPSGTNPAPIRLAEQIRELSPQEANQHLPVSVRGVVTCAHPGSAFAYIQDASGGIKVVNPQWEIHETIRPGMVVALEGQTCAGEFVSMVTNAVLRRVGWWNLEAGRLISLEQAFTGLEDGQWVEMSGFVRTVTWTNGLALYELSTSGGEFLAWAPSSQPFERFKGTIVRLQGVCSAVANARHQLTGIQMWVPAEQYIQVEEGAPADLFAAPLRRLGDLRRFDRHNSLRQWVRTAGTVVMQVPGRYLCLQDGPDSLFALSQQPDLLQLGDRVEVVGFPGTKGQRFLLREAVYRRVGSGAEPAAVPIPAHQSLDVDLEGRLANAQGTLLNVAEKGGETRLLLRSGASVFEAKLEALGAGSRLPARPVLALGSRLALTGIYEVQHDEYSVPRSFLLHLRSWADVRLLQRPPWWTPLRLVYVILGVCAVSLAALGWALLSSRRNALLEQARADLQTAHDKLELRVEERTRDLASSLSLLHATLESTADGILVVDQNGRVTSYNTKFARMWALPAELLAGHADRPSLLAAVAGQLKDGAAFLEASANAHAESRAETFGLLEFQDGRVFEQYSQSQCLDGQCVGRVWCFRDITERRRAAAELDRAHKQLVETSRQVGMAEVATDVLHNVGNVLNSVNVSATLVDDRLRQSSAEKLGRAVALLEEQRHDLPAFLTRDPKGQRLPAFLKALGLSLVQEQQVLLAEVESLRKNIDHIKAIIAMQQSLARLGGAFEECDPREMMEDALQITGVAFERDQVQVRRDFQPVPRVLADRHKVLQILVNLLTNARHALATLPRTERRVILSILATDAGQVCLRVSDNGAGIEAQHLGRIFNQGFTTRKDGHGFGLHSAAIAAKELQGTLSVQSDGPGKGASFTLELPIPKPNAQ